MPVPGPILRLVESHSCFSGCYAPDSELMCLVDPARPPESVAYIQCQDCLSFRVGSTMALLAPGMDRHKLAREVTEHLRTLRGYALSFGGYHVQGGGFWLSAAYYAHLGVFVLRSSGGSPGANQSAVDLLVKAFKTGVATPPLPGMCDPKRYLSQKAFLNITALPQLVTARSLFAAGGSQKRSQGYVEVTLAEYLPVSRAAAGASVSPGAKAPSAVVRSASAPASAVSRALGSRCDVCGELVTERALLTSVYRGCGCD